MRLGLRIAALTVAAWGLVATLAATAQAYVYWTNVGPGFASDGTTLGRANNDGSGFTDSLITTASGPAGIAVDAHHIYWANSQTNSIGIANLDGSGANPKWIANATTQGTPTAVTVDSAHVYWTDGIQYVGRADLMGKNANDRFINDGPSNGANGLGIAGSTLFISEFDRIDTVPLAGGTPTTLVTLSGNVVTTGLAVAGGYVYWAAVDLNKAAPDGEIGRVLTSGGDLHEAFIPNLSFPTGVATDGTELYWVDHNANAIGRALLGSTGATNIQPAFESPPGGPYGVAIDSLIDPTQTAISCTPTTVATGSPSSCTATVSDSASSATPTGTVVFSSNGAVFFSGSSSCTLTKSAGGGASCVVAAVPTNAGTAPINGAYGGDAIHSPSNGTTNICATPSTVCSQPVSTSPSNTTPPAISGTAAPGHPLSCSQGSWSGTAPIGYAYQWLRDGSPIGGATAPTYTVAAIDGGHALSCTVTATNSVGGASATSSGVSVPKPLLAKAGAGRAKALSGGTVKVSLSCTGPAGSKCTVSLALTVVETLSGHRLLAVTAVRKTRRTVTLRATTVTLQAGARKTVLLRLNAVGQHLLAARHTLKVKLSIKQLMGTGSGRQISTQKLTLKPAPKRKRRR